MGVSLGVTQILAFLDTNMLVSPTQNSHVGGIAQRDGPTRVFSRCNGIYYIAVSEIKGAPCTRRAHFHGLVHDLLLLYIGRLHGAITGCTVLWEVHPASAQNKSLISDTVYRL